MGLNFKNSKVCWSYSGFAAFRRHLAEGIGIKLGDMKGFGGSPQKSWNKVKDDIAPFLSHSDCEGELTPAQCLKIAPRLREIVKDWDEHDYDRHQALWLADDMEKFAKKKQPLVFC